MAAVDFNALRARAMGSGADEEAVTVNTRALIDKVLARYSGEWTVLRELLQNAADACATTVSVKFETLPSTSVPAPSATDPTSSIKHVIAHHTVKRLLLTNNGIPFTSNDWSRLKRIAEGNPDETKIGAFGVGFYSVFSDCEEPFVSSGNEAMAFYWKGNALFTRRLQMGEADSSPNTNFVLDYRSTTSPVPALLPLCQFLASSLTFAGLETVELWLDNWNLLTLSKKVAPSVKVSIPRDIETQTAEGMMKVASVNREVAQMDATCMSAVHYKPRSTSSRYESIRNNDTTASLRSFFSRLTTSSNENSVAKSNKTEKPKENGATEDLTAATKSSVFLHITTGHIRTSVSQSFSRELERATKKPPPKTTTLAILTSSHEAYSGQNDACRDGKPDILASVLPSKSGRIFIGFPTHQTTGLNAHVSAPSIIPTVERESIDLNARWVRSWNVELLRAVGVICRIAWSAEMASLNDRIILKTERPGKSSVPQEILASFLPEAIHTSNQFVFRESTPTAQVGGAVEDSFWTCSKNAFIDILSTCGVLPSHQIRIAPKDLSFMDKIPVLPEALMSGAKDFVDRLIYLGLVTDITVSDIKNELESHALTSGQLDEFLAWISRRASSNEIDSATVQSLLGAAVANDERPDGSTQRVLVLADIKSYVNPSRVPADFPIPPFVMPFRYTKHLSQWQLASLGWHELGVDVWIQWLLQNSKNRDILSAEHDMTETPSFSAQVLPILSKHLDSLAPTSRAAVVNILQSHTIMPTKAGMKRPSETYFPSVKLFDDLPVVTGLNNVKEKFLMSLGVRKTVELSVIFERLLNPSHQTTDDKVTERRKWSHVDLIKYLASVRNDIPSADIEKLKKARFCSAESDQKSGSGVRYKVSELFEPNDSLRGLELPLLYWPTRYMPTSPEAKFLNHLGLRKFPSASELIELMACAPANQDFGLRDKAMSYFVTEHVANGYGSIDSSKVTTPYLPIEGSTTLSTPNKCFTDSGSTMFGFNVLRKDLHVHASKFGVKQHPPLGDCIGILTRQPPASGKQATIIFSYFAGRLGEFNEAIKDRVARASIVPMSSNLSSANNFPQEKAPHVRHVRPQECYIGESEEYGDLFEFVDFGQEANLFLLACGSKRQPTKIEVASLLVKEPAKISSKLRDPEKYLNLLRAIAESMSLIKRHKDLFRDMKRAPFLLASKELPPSKSNAEKLVDADDPDYEEDDRGIKEWQLVRATDAIVVDDFSSFSLFKHAILAAPQEELLEDMYMALGTPGLNSLVEEQARIGPRLQNSNLATRVQKRISERSRLFLHDMSREYIRRDTRWLEQNLSVQVVQTLSLRRSLKGRNVSHTEKRNAVVTQSQRDWVLSIGSGPPDYYQISQMLVHVILSRPKLHSTLTLEMLLKTDLMELKARGYNVDRILKQKAAEARMAETRRQQQLEEERKQMQDVEMQSRNDEGQVSKPQNEQLSMPGVFPDSTGTNKKAADNDHVPELPSSGEQRGFGGLFSNFTRRFEEYTRGNSQIQSTLQTLRDGTNTAPGPEGPPPPPYTVDDPQHQQHGKPHKVTSLHNLQSNLHSAVKACRPHGSSTVYNQGEKEQVVETKSYCDERPGHDLECIGHSDSRLRVFLTKSVKDRSSFLKDNMAGINAFATVLAHCASVFDVHIDSVNIFHETGGKTIAFNSRGSIFCNYLYFQQLHEANVLQGDQKAKKDTLVYWWVIFCHELAHNLVSTHSAEHSYYTEGFVAQYFANLSEKLVQYAAASAPAASVR